MEAFILLLVQGGMTAAQVGRLIGEHDTRIWRVLQHYVQEGRRRADFSGVTMVGMDETSRARGQAYVSLFMDLLPGRRRVLFVCPDRNAQTVGLYPGGPRPAWGRSRCHPPALHGHVAGLYQGGGRLSAAGPDHLRPLPRRQTRRRSGRRGTSRGTEAAPELKGTRYLWLKNEWNHTEKQAEQWASINGCRLETGRAWLLKSALQDVFLPENQTDGPVLLTRWCAWAQRSRLLPMVELARTLRRHWAGVVNWFDSQISNGVLEAINGLVQAAKRRARGYRNVYYLITMIYLLLGKLDFQLPALSPAVTHPE